MIVTVFGGSGFVGRHVVKALAAKGHRVRVAVRRPDLAGFLTSAGGVGQIALMQANVRYPSSVLAAVQGADVVVNCVGILAESGRQSFTALHSRGAAVIAEAASAVHAKLVHISAIGADKASESAYAVSKGLAEEAVLKLSKDAIILRPSVVFGAEDQFLNRFAKMATLSPALPLIGSDTKFQPVYVGDVAEMVVKGVEGRLKAGAVYELGGKETLSFKDILAHLLKIIDRKRVLVPVPFGLAKMMGTVLQYAPTTPLTRDQVLMLEHDNVVSSEAVTAGLTLVGVGIDAKTITDIAPSYLWRFRPQGQFNAITTAA
jgi:uncharacterized protein YbjT (DUF2867 family)